MAGKCLGLGPGLTVRTYADYSANAPPVPAVWSGRWDGVDTDDALWALGRELDAQSDRPVLGIDSIDTYYCKEAAAPGSESPLFTDGLIQAFTPDGVLPGDEKTARVFRGLGVAGLRRRGDGPRALGA